MYGRLDKVEKIKFKEKDSPELPQFNYLFSDFFNCPSSFLNKYEVKVSTVMPQTQTNNSNVIYSGGADLDTTFTINESDADSLFSTGSHQFGADDDRDDQTLLPLTQHSNRSSSSVFSFETIPMIPLSQTQARGPELQKKVSFVNGLGLVVGMMIGSGLFSSPGRDQVYSCC